jgi:hypothetical protein
MEMLKSEACVLGSKRNRDPKNTQEAHLWNQASGRTNKTRSVFRPRKLPETTQPAPPGVAAQLTYEFRGSAEAFCINHTANAPQVALELLTIPGGLASSVTRPLSKGVCATTKMTRRATPSPKIQAYGMCSSQEKSAASSRNSTVADKKEKNAEDSIGACF